MRLNDVLPSIRWQRPAATLLLLGLWGCTTVTDDSSVDVAPAGTPTLAERAQAIHARSLVLDAHADIVTPGVPSPYVGPDGLSKVHPTKLVQGGVDAVVMSVAVGPGPRTPEADAVAQEEAMTKLALALDITKQENVVLARSPAEMKAAHAQGQRAILLGFQNARSLAGDVDALDRFYDAGVRIFGLNHLGHNDFADSSRPLFDGATGKYEPAAEHGGLSELGRAAVARVNALGGLVDVSQLSKDATLQTIALSKTPVIASHSNVRTLSQVSRNLSDEEIDRIGETGGVIHLAPFRAYLLDQSDPDLIARIKATRRNAGIDEKYSYPYELYWEIEDLEARSAFTTAITELLGPATVADLANHIDYVVQRIGVEHVGIGTDFNHGSGIDGFFDASEALNLTTELLRRGYTAPQIEQIWGGNFLRVFDQAQRAAVN